MKITCLDGTPLNHPLKSEGYIKGLSAEFSRAGHVTSVFRLAEMNLKYCTGCWNCWWKTPGLCALDDEGALVFKEVIQSDFLIFFSPLIAGFTSAELKKMTDRLIVLIHPFMTIIQGEFHHRKRYEKYPNFGLLLAPEHDSDEEDIQIVNSIYDRLAINFHSRRVFTEWVPEVRPEKILYAVHHH